MDSFAFFANFFTSSHFFFDFRFINFLLARWISALLSYNCWTFRTFFALALCFAFFSWFTFLICCFLPRAVVSPPCVYVCAQGCCVFHSWNHSGSLKNNLFFPFNYFYLFLHDSTLSLSGLNFFCFSFFLLVAYKYTNYNFIHIFLRILLVTFPSCSFSVARKKYEQK